MSELVCVCGYIYAHLCICSIRANQLTFATQIPSLGSTNLDCHIGPSQSKAWRTCVVVLTVAHLRNQLRLWLQTFTPVMLEPEHGSIRQEENAHSKCWVCVLSCLLLACLYVGSLYIWRSSLPRYTIHQQSSDSTVRQGSFYCYSMFVCAFVCAGTILMW